MLKTHINPWKSTTPQHKTDTYLKDNPSRKGVEEECFALLDMAEDSSDRWVVLTMKVNCEPIVNVTLRNEMD